MSGTTVAPRSPIREALQHLTGESLIYGLGQVSGRAVNLLLVPILTRTLTPEAVSYTHLTLPTIYSV